MTERTRDVTDGGETVGIENLGNDRSPFDQVSETTLSRKERLQQKYDRLIVAPGRILWSDWRARVGVAIILLYVLMGTVGVWLTEPTQLNDAPRLLLPFQDWAHPLGSDGNGRDLLRLTIHATPHMLQMILAGAVFTTAFATAIGAVSGYLGGSATDRILMTMTDIAMTIPGLPLVIIVAVALEPESAWLIGIIVVINYWAGLARTIRSQVLTIRRAEYVEASKTLGLSTRSIVTKDIIPNVMPYIFVNFVNAARQVIFASVGLYFLGLLPRVSANWGVMMQDGYTGGALLTWSAAHWLLVPMVTIVVLSFGLILFAQGTDRIFNPRVRARHAKSTSDENTDDEEESTATPVGAIGGGR